MSSRDWRGLAKVRQNIIYMLERRIDRLERELHNCTCRGGQG